MKRTRASNAALLVAGSLSCAGPQPASPAPSASPAPGAPSTATHLDTSAGDAGDASDAAAAADPSTAAARRAEPFPTDCRSDADCGYDPAMDRCGSDPRNNRQPPVMDQGIICYCDTPRASCDLLRVLPTPCEGDHGCAVRLDPRPHPVRATEEHPHERGRPCRDFTIATSCERTNICTMRHLACPARPEEKRQKRKASARTASGERGASPR